MYLYLIAEEDTDFCKVGIAGNVQQRLIQLQSGSSRNLRIVESIPCNEAARAESIVKSKLIEFHLRSEWYKVQPEYAIEVMRAAVEEVDKTPSTSAIRANSIELLAERTVLEPEYRVFSNRVIVHGFDKLTPRAARAALEIAFGNSSYGRVWAPDMSYGYQVYAKSARKIHPDLIEE